MATRSAKTALPFLDTDVLLYALSADARKADRCEALLRSGAVIGVQVLNEFANVALKKFRMPWQDIDDVLALIRLRCKVLDLTVAVHDEARARARRFQLQWFDALIVAAAVDAGSAVLVSEDLQHGFQVTQRLQIRNPFVGA